ncbi:MAG: tRNA (adenosine(37)-N6)-threonylcarbamoyltransferase complex dimerization subunit type 1 TsaB [Tissierellales bacterium]|nr:tRNA (adenosine(37)-N6)-threonylcarbamoyltransferase complex dimerization subunit type 1 TsaB [Tissierellales bacterium]MBN2828369.1 tRNA (adenosine(37)-N6)-threonylcarbamoyltransferase complex dimerization subunit type 1 TsaB [Tissierellales bacterium]
MIILGIESSGEAASCAVTNDTTLLGEYTLNHKLTHSEKLMPMLTALLQSLHMSMDNIDLLCVDEGPGSYTGLRIGVAIAKGLAWHKKIPIVGIPSTAALAYQIQNTDYPILPMMDARGGRVFYGRYQWENKELKTLYQPDLIDVDILLREIFLEAKSYVFTGNASKKYSEKIHEKFGKSIITNSYDDVIKANSICCLGYTQYLKGLSATADCFVPNYLRPSQAERMKSSGLHK